MCYNKRKMSVKDGYIITDAQYSIKDSNSYSYVYTYAFTSNPPISNSNNIDLFTFNPSYNSLAPSPSPPNYNDTQIKEFGICENACYQCIEPYTYSLGAFVSLCVILTGMILVKKINFKNMFRKRPKKNRSYRRPINNTNINNDIDFGINSSFV